MQNWRKEGLIYDGRAIEGYSYASVPAILPLTDGMVRVYFCSRNESNNSIPFYFDFNLETKQIEHLNEEPLLNLGDPGAFDDSGIMPTCIVKNQGEVWMYYIGWNLGLTVPFRNSIGLAVSNDGGRSFKKKYEGPIVDRTKDEPHFTASCMVMKESDLWRLWYLNCVKWEQIDGRLTHSYHIKYAESNNGIDWKRNGKVAIEFKYKNEYAISTPRVLKKQDDTFMMWFSYRGGDRAETYRIGFAESQDGIDWERKDEEVRLDVSDEGWDSDMICYPDVMEYKGELFMFYNGNGYGQSGIGLAKLN